MSTESPTNQERSHRRVEYPIYLTELECQGVLYFNKLIHILFPQKHPDMRVCSENETGGFYIEIDTAPHTALTTQELRTIGITDFNEDTGPVLRHAGAPDIYVPFSVVQGNPELNFSSRTLYHTMATLPEEKGTLAIPYYRQVFGWQEALRVQLEMNRKSKKLH